ncbi:borealin-2 [Aulostomus maculatus]
MPVRRTRNAANVQNKEHLSREMRRSRLALFIQQFEKEAQERLNELEGKMEDMLATVDKVFKVELMKMPPSLRNTRIGDLISEEEISASEVSIAMRNESLEMHQPLRRVPSKRGKSTNSPPVQPNQALKSSAKTSRGAKASKRTRTLVGSNSTGNLRCSAATVKRTLSHSAKPADEAVTRKPKLRSVESAGDLHCSAAGSAAHISVTTAQGQTVCFSEETKDEINVDLLDDMAWCQIQNLSVKPSSLTSVELLSCWASPVVCLHFQRLIEYLSGQSRCQR